MSGINCGIYPVIPIPEEQVVIDIINANQVLLDEILATEDTIADELANITDVLEPEADGLIADLNASTSVISNFAGSGAMGAYVGFCSDTSIPSVATPTTIMSIELSQIGTYLVSFSFYVGTNTANGGITPLVQVSVYLTLEGVILPNMPLVYYPQSALANKQGFDIAVSDVVPIFNTAFFPGATLSVQVNVAPENSGYGTFCSGRCINAVCVSPQSS